MQGKEFVSPIYVQQKQDDARDQAVRLQQHAARPRHDWPATSPPRRPTYRWRRTGPVSSSSRWTSASARRRSRSRSSPARLERDVSRDMVITAPIDGVVTNIGPARGQTVANDTQVATILPKDDRVACRVAGAHTCHRLRAHPANAVTLRYEAFPYERFGQYRGQVESGRQGHLDAGPDGRPAVGARAGVSHRRGRSIARQIVVGRRRLSAAGGHGGQRRPADGAAHAARMAVPAHHPAAPADAGRHGMTGAPHALIDEPGIT